MEFKHIFLSVLLVSSFVLRAAVTTEELAQELTDLKNEVEQVKRDVKSIKTFIRAHTSSEEFMALTRPSSKTLYVTGYPQVSGGHNLVKYLQKELPGISVKQIKKIADIPESEVDTATVLFVYFPTSVRLLEIMGKKVGEFHECGQESRGRCLLTLIRSLAPGRAMPSIDVGKGIDAEDMSKNIAIRPPLNFNIGLEGFYAPEEDSTNKKSLEALKSVL